MDIDRVFDGRNKLTFSVTGTTEEMGELASAFSRIDPRAWPLHGAIRHAVSHSLTEVTVADFSGQKLEYIAQKLAANSGTDRSTLAPVIREALGSQDYIYQPEL